MRFFILLLGLLCFLAGDEVPTIPPSKLPADATKLLAKADADIVAIRKTLVAALQKSQEAATKKGDLDGALAIKARIEDIGKEMPSKPVAPITETGPIEYQGAVITRATFGTDGHAADCMALIRRIVAGGEVFAITNTSLGYDPAPNQPKHITIKWQEPSGRTRITILEEGRQLTVADVFSGQQ